MTPPHALLSDLAAAPCGSQALDKRIALALGWEELPDEHSPHSGVWMLPDANISLSLVPPWSTSTDAALTLVPDGMWYLIGKGRTRPGEPLYGAQVLLPDRTGLVSDVVADGQGHVQATALCIAALRARGAA